MRYILTLAFLLASAIHVAGQYAAVLKGRVMCGAEPVPFASVVIEGTPVGTASDINGRFTFHDPPKNSFRLHFSAVGYNDTTVYVHASARDVMINVTRSDEQLDEVVITGTMKEMSKLDSPVPVEVYSSEFFVRNPAPSVFESMQNVNGVKPQINCNVCNTGDIHINGLEGPYTMVLIDGMPIVSGLSTVYGLTGIPQALIDRVEVVKGPASTLYGSEAVGGLINVITKDPASSSRVAADISGTSWGEFNTDLGVRFRTGTKATSLVGINYFNFNETIDKNGDGFTDVAMQDRISIFNKWDIDRPGYKIFSLAFRYV